MEETPAQSPYPEMPQLEQVPLDRALRLLGRLGIRPQVRLISGEERGIVLDQMPPAGTPLEPGIPVWIQVAEDNPIRLLPEVLHEDDKKEWDDFGSERPPHMMRNFLFIIQTFFTGLDRDVRSMHRQLTPEGASGSFLPWLLRLVPMELDSGWSEARMREILRDAPRLLRLRGTAQGLIEMIELYTGVRVSVRENHWPHRGTVIGVTRVSETAIVSSVPREDYAVTVELPADQEITRERLEAILRVVDLEKPASIRVAVVRGKKTHVDQAGADRVGEGYRVGQSVIPGPLATPPARMAASRLPSSWDAELLKLGRTTPMDAPSGDA